MNAKLTELEKRFYNILKRGGRYTLADFTHEMGGCQVYGLMMSLQAKGIGIAHKSKMRDDGTSYELFWLAE